MQELTELINRIREANLLELHAIINVALGELMRRMEQIEFNQERGKTWK